jgi:outer membrane biosynthesis protein TonB
MDVSSLLNHSSPTSPLSSLPTKTSRQKGDEEDEGMKPLIPPITSTQAKSPALPMTKSKPNSKSKSKSKSQSKPKPKLVPTPSEKPPKKTKTKSSTPPDPKPRPWTTADKIVLFNIVSSTGASIKNFEGAIEGRSGLACYNRWK